jgi:hypothetical protein
MMKRKEWIFVWPCMYVTGLIVLILLLMVR